MPKRVLNNNIDQRISPAIISHGNLTRFIPDEIYLLDLTRTIYSQSCNISKWCMQKVHFCRPYKMPKLADWPKEKINKAESFTYTELDYIGPFTSKIEKRRFGSVFLHVQLTVQCSWKSSMIWRLHSFWWHYKDLYHEGLLQILSPLTTYPILN